MDENQSSIYIFFSYSTFVKLFNLFSYILILQIVHTNIIFLK